MITAQEFSKIEDIVRQAVDPIKTDINSVQTSLGALSGSVDKFLHISRGQKQELTVLRGQHKKMRHVLVKKGVATEDELSIS